MQNRCFLKDYQTICFRAQITLPELGVRETFLPWQVSCTFLKAIAGGMRSAPRQQTLRQHDTAMKQQIQAQFSSSSPLLATNRCCLMVPFDLGPSGTKHHPASHQQPLPLCKSPEVTPQALLVPEHPGQDGFCSSFSCVPSKSPTCSHWHPGTYI